MPTVYRAECTNCGKSPEADGGVAGWVSMDGRKGGRIFPEGCLALKLDHGEFVCLPHPVETSTLNSHGFTWIKAARQNRLYRVTYKICLQCGLIHEECQHDGAQSGCMMGLFSVPLTTLFFRFGYEQAWGKSILSGCFIMMMVFMAIAFLNWVRWWKPNQALRLKTCMACGGQEFITVSQAAAGKPLFCPCCKTQNMKYTVAGRS